MRGRLHTWKGLLTPVPPPFLVFAPQMQQQHYHCHVCQRQGAGYVYFVDHGSLMVGALQCSCAGGWGWGALC